MTSPARTRTGAFPVGLRLTGPFAKAPADETIAWSRDAGFACVDLPAAHVDRIPAWRDAGLSVGTIDLFRREWGGMLSANPDTRRATVELAAAHIRRAAAAGARTFFVLMLAEDAKLPRAETFGYAVETYGALLPTLDETDTQLAIEGWPGANAQACTPESIRALFAALPSPRLGLNFDPSHLVRMGIDAERFLREFAPRVVHAHAKDTLVDTERLYELGHEQAGVFAKPLGWGGWYWRYTLPGRGQISWAPLFGLLASAGYRGAVAIELEDADYNGDLERERHGFLAARDFLART